MSDILELKNQIEKAKSVLVLTKKNPSLDGVAASLALYLVLKNSGKDVQIASQSDPIVRDSHLVGLDKIKTDIGNTNLVIVFPGNSVEKVSANEEENTFNLVIQPKSGSSLLNHKDLKFKYTGATADLVIIVGSSSLDSVGTILTDEEDLVKNSLICNISNLPSNFGKINLVDTNCSISEITSAVIQETGLEMTEDAAQNLMLGIEDATNNLTSPDITADTFEALALLYRSGARRIRPSDITIEEKESLDQITKSLNTKTPSNVSDSSLDSDPDWLKPKIYKGSTKLQ